MNEKQINREFAIVGFDKDLLFDLIVCGHSIYGYFSLEDKFNGYRYLGDHENIGKIPENIPVIVSVDDINLRAQLFSEYEKRLTTYISPTATIAPNAIIGAGGLVMSNTLISTSVSIGRCTKINVGVQVHHDVRIGDFCVIAPRVLLLGNVEVENSSFLGSGCMIRNNIKISKNSTIGMASNVIQDVPPNSVCFGNPATIKKYNAPASSEA